MAEGNLHRYWCDGITFGSFFFEDERPRLLGNAWMCDGQGKFEEWRCELLLPQHYKSLEDIDWDKLLPPDNVTRWLAIDPRRRFIQLEPMAAVPDLT